MKLIDKWRESHKLYSMQLMYFATICDIIMACIVIIDQRFPFEPLWYVGIRLALTLASMVARLVAQKDN